MPSSVAGEVLPNPIFEGSEKRLEVHFADADPVRAPASAEGLRAIDRASLDSLMALAACEIVSCTSNAALDSYVLSESSLFVYSRTWILKTCGNTKLLDCLEKLLDVARQLRLVPCFGKYSRASYLYPGMQPQEYQSFDHELDSVRVHLGHIGNGGSAFVLGDKYHGLQWHLFVVSDDTAPAQGGMPARVVNTATAASQDRPLHTLEVCMTDLEASAAQQFVRTKDFVSSVHTTNATGIRALRPHAAIDDYLFEPCGYSMNGIDGGEHMTIHVTPEEACSYASCELHGFEEHSFDPATMVTSITGIFRPGRLVVACATKSNGVPGSYQWAATIAVPGYACAGATCQELPTGGRVWFYSLVRDCFSHCPRTLSSPARLSQWPSFAGNSLRRIPSEDRMDTLSLKGKGRGSGAYPDSGSSGSDMDITEFACSPTVASGRGPPLRAVTTLHATDKTAVLKFAACLTPWLPHDSTAFIINLSAVSAAVKRWRAVLPAVAPLHNVADCPDAAVLLHLQQQSTAFVASTAEDIAALRRAGLTLDRTVVHAAGWPPRDVRAAVAAGAQVFAVSSSAQLVKLQRFAPSAKLLLVAHGQDAGARSMAVAASAARAGLAVRGVLVTGDTSSEAAAAETVALARQVCCELEEEGHMLERVMFSDAEGGCCMEALAVALADERAWTDQLAVCAGGAALVSDALTMLANVYTVDEEGVHVTDLPPAVDSCDRPQAVVLGCHESEETQVTDVMDGVYHGQFLLPPIKAGDWLAFHCGGGMLNGRGGALYYVDADTAGQPCNGSITYSS